jgi:BirA family biotin operon repressor/biotin-[acetyl-CoA-carboxylase] ligase
MSSEITLGVPLIRLDQTDSTNACALKIIKKGNAAEGTVILAAYQTHGRGQKGNSWESERGKNLLFSFILLPRFLEARKQFYLLMSISLGLVDLMLLCGIKAIIKWPNDIYVSGRKIGGILIENSLAGNYLTSTVAGIGLNVNQTSFTASVSHPTSLKIELGREINCEILFSDAIKHLTEWIRKLYRKEWTVIQDQYLRHLMHYDQWAEYIDSTGNFRGRIAGILDGGELVVEKQNGILHHYAFREIEYRL